MERTFGYPARFEPDEDGRILVTFPDLAGVATDGADLVEARIQARDALSVGLGEIIARGGELPAASHASLFALAKLSLNVAFAEAGLSVSEVARRLDIDPKEVRRLLDPREPSKLARMEDALDVLGYRLTGSAERAERPPAPAQVRRSGGATLRMASTGVRKDKRVGAKRTPDGRRGTKKGKRSA
jgi:antitoxin HicB